MNLIKNWYYGGSERANPYDMVDGYWVEGTEYYIQIAGLHGYQIYENGKLLTDKSFSTIKEATDYIEEA